MVTQYGLPDPGWSFVGQAIDIDAKFAYFKWFVECCTFLGMPEEVACPFLGVPEEAVKRKHANAGKQGTWQSVASYPDGDGCKSVFSEVAGAQ
jgi:hypothetical protein